MFAWLVSKQKFEDSEDHSEEDSIPVPPLPNRELAEKIRKTYYDPTFYYIPDDLFVELKMEVENRKLRQLEENRSPDVLLLEIQTEIENRKMRQVRCNPDVLLLEIQTEIENRKMRQVRCNPDVLLLEIQTEIENRKMRQMEEGRLVTEEERQVRENRILEEIQTVEDEIAKFEIEVQEPKRLKMETDWDKPLEWSEEFKTELEEVVVDIPDIRGIPDIPDIRGISVSGIKVEPENPEGYLEIYMGPMFSGKSTKIFFKLTSMADQRFRCLYVNSIKDFRESEAMEDDIISTHNSSYSHPSPKITSIKVKSLDEVDVDNFDYIAVDELQFFDDAYSNILDWVESGKYVMVASLDGDCYRRKFGCVLDLIPHANEIFKLNAYCDICRDNYGKLVHAPFTGRLTSDTSVELVGGKDLYKAMCRSCHDYHLNFQN